MLTTSRLFGLFIACTLGAACGSAGRQAEGEPKPLALERQIDLAAGKMVELNLDVPTSTLVAAAPVDPIVVAFEASAPLAWNVHVHPEGKVEVLAEGLDAARTIEHTPSRPGPISLLWENKSDAAVRVTLRVKGVPAGTTGEWYE